MLTALTFVYLACFQLAAVPSAVRIIRRRCSNDLSTWREWMILLGVITQFGVMATLHSDWRILISPVCSGVTVSALLVAIYWHRRPER